MPSPLERCISLLSDFVGYHTDNPAGDELALCQRLGQELHSRGAEQVEVVEVPRDHGRSGYVYARYGAPRLLLNVHIDTVPANTGWTRDPFRAERDGPRIHGLGTADIKGAAAAILTALDQVRPDGVGILFSGDEERGGRCVPAFVASGRARGLEAAIVCEPSARAAGVATAASAPTGPTCAAAAATPRLPTACPNRWSPWRGWRWRSTSSGPATSSAARTTCRASA
jgi:acetylornithine deacetylase